MCFFLIPGCGVTLGASLLSFLPALCILGKLGKSGEGEESREPLALGKPSQSTSNGVAAACPIPGPAEDVPKLRTGLWGTRSALRMDQCQVQGPAGGELGSRTRQRSHQKRPPAKPRHLGSPTISLPPGRSGCRGQRTSPLLPRVLKVTLLLLLPATHTVHVTEGKPRAEEAAQHSHGSALQPYPSLIPPAPSKHAHSPGQTLCSLGSSSFPWAAGKNLFLPQFPCAYHPVWKQKRVC